MSSRRRPLRSVPATPVDAPQAAEEPETATDSPARAEPALEAGVAPTEQTTQEVAPEWAMTAELTAAELAEIRRRNDTTDWSTAEAKALRERAAHMERVSAYSQQALTAYLQTLLGKYRLHPDFVFNIDFEGGRIVPAGPRGGAKGG